MRVALVVHGLPPFARTGVETHAAALATALAELEHEVEVFCPRALPGLLPFAQRREERGSWAVTWVNDPGVSVAPHAKADVLPADLPSLGISPAQQREKDIADAFGAFLDRERPELVHFEQLERLGIGTVEEAAKRGLPTVYCAHDFFAASDSPTLLAPDLSGYELGDIEAETRAALARGVLDGARLPGDHGGTALREQLSEEIWTEVQRCLDAPTSELSGFEPQREEIKALLQRRRGAFATFDARFATSRYLAKKLGGVLGRAVDWRSVGVDSTRLQATELTAGAERPIRFGFMGGIRKPRGLHLLLEAFDRLDKKTARLVIHGDSDDRAYIQRMRARALEVGAEWEGPYRAEDVHKVLASFDVLVVPSLWTENAPFVIREAFAARHPVIAPRSDAIDESVKDDVDGLLFERGDEESLHTVMRRFIEEEWLHDRLEMKIEEPKAIQAEAREWVDTYTELLATSANRRARPRLPAHITEFARRYDALAEQPTREIFARVVNGLEALAGQMGLRAEVKTFLTLAAGRGSRLRDNVVEDRRAIDWLRRSVEAQQSARGELEERSEWHESRLAELRGQLDGYEQEMTTHEAEFEALRAERTELEARHAEVAAKKDAGDRARADLEEERDRLQKSLEEKEAAQKALGRQLQGARDAIANLESERSHMQKTLEEGAAELRWLRERVAGEDAEGDGLTDREAIERHFESLEEELDGLRVHEQWLREEVSGLVVALGTKADGSGAEDTPQAELAEALSAASDGLERVVKELAWRREEMSEARRASETLFARIAGGELANRARTWTDSGPREVEA